MIGDVGRSLWRREAAPPMVADLTRREPLLAARVLAWRGDDRLECVSLDRRGRYWLWRETVCSLPIGDDDTGLSYRRLMIPQFGPVTLGGRTEDACAAAIRGCIDALASGLAMAEAR